jgi:hypothetical protein
MAAVGRRALPVDEASRLWAITSYFNPIGFRRRLATYRTFREHLAVPLLTVEWSLDGRFDLVSADAEVLVQVSSPDLMWQKERLLDVALHALPRSVDLVAWLDGDVVFPRADWAEAARRLLEDVPLVQLFRRCRFLGPNGSYPGGEPVETAASLVHLVRQAGGDPTLLARVWGRSADGGARRRLAGLAWAGRRELLSRHGFYDACVFGAGDRALACAAFGEHRRAWQAWRRTPGQERHYLAWAEPFAAEVGGRVGLVEGDLVHLWHGRIEDRQHGIRHDAAQRHAFDPGTDLRIDPGTGLWRWASAKPDLHRAVVEFFHGRREDGAPA